MTIITGDKKPNIIHGGIGPETILGLEGDDQLFGGGGNDLIFGGIGNDKLFGELGNDTLEGGTGADQMTGGAGDDTYVRDNNSDLITEALNGGTDLVKATVTTALGANVENLTLLGAVALSGTGNTLGNILIGNSAANTLSGLAGNDTLNGGLGADNLRGGAGNDVYVVDNTGDTVDESVAGSSGVDTIQSSITFSLANALRVKGPVENLTLLGAAAINATGNGLANVLTGNTGANVLDGGALADVMKGGGGNDRYMVDNLGDVVDESPAGSTGTDTVQSSVNFSFADAVHAKGALENMILTGTATTGTGNSLANIITGNAGANTLNGGLGNDTLIGGAGSDTLNGGDGASDFASYENSTSAVIARLQFLFTFDPLGDAAGDTFSGIENLRGTNNTTDVTRQDSIAFQDIMIGKSNANTLEGLAGNDILYGGAGADRLDGGAGEDMAFYFQSGGVTASLATPGTNTGDAAGDTYISIEDLAGDFGSADTLTGNSSNNRLWGLGGADHLIGGGGNDVLSGGSAFGQNLAFLDGADILDGGIGIDTADYTQAHGGGVRVDLFNGTGQGGEAEGDTFISIENVIGTMFGDTLVASLAANRLDGGDGNDLADYSNSTSAVTVNLTTHAASGGFAAGDVLVNIENLLGSGHADILTGSAAGNSFDGLGGIDTMTGGLGDDTYAIGDTGDVINENLAGGTDTVNASVTYTLSANIEVLNLMASTGAIDGTGNAQDNTITGNGSANRIDGGAGVDTMVGQLGDDTYVVDDVSDEVDEFSGEGTDTVIVSGMSSYQLGNNFENLESAVAGFIGVGNALDNVISITSNGKIDGQDGIDTLSGAGAGHSTEFVLHAELGADTIANFGAGTNTLDMASVEFNILTLDATNLFNGTTTASGNGFSQLLFDNTNSNLYFDVDGMAGDAVLVATLTGVTRDLTASDFLVI